MSEHHLQAVEMHILELHLHLFPAGADSSDATSALRDVPDFAAGLLSPSQLSSKPLEGKKIGLVGQAMGEGVDAGVLQAVKAAVTHLEALGAIVEEVSPLEAGLGGCGACLAQCLHALSIQGIPARFAQIY